MELILVEIGKKIKEYRTLCGYTQEKLAELIGVSTNSISAWENGKYKVNKEHLELLCSTLHITEKDLYISSLNLDAMDESSVLYQIYNEVKNLSILKQKQILDIIRTFKD